MNQKYKKKATVDSDRNFMNKKLGEIFSHDISERFCKYSLDHNKLVIESLINEEDEMKRNYFTKLFNLTFRDCLMHLSGDKNFEELEGFKGTYEITTDKGKGDFVLSAGAPSVSVMIKY